MNIPVTDGAGFFGLALPMREDMPPEPSLYAISKYGGSRALRAVAAMFF